MRHLGFERFYVAGHDRGGRCAYRMALDFPERVLRLAVLDILPTSEHFRRADMHFGLGYWHWFFLAQPFDEPERIIGADPRVFFTRMWPKDANGVPQPPPYFAPEALEDYLRCYLNSATVHATCEDYRAGATYDFELDEADRANGRRIACPVLVLWGARGALPWGWPHGCCAGAGHRIERRRCNGCLAGDTGPDWPWHGRGAIRA